MKVKFTFVCFLAFFSIPGIFSLSYEDGLKKVEEFKREVYASANGSINLMNALFDNATDYRTVLIRDADAEHFVTIENARNQFDVLAAEAEASGNQNATRCIMYGILEHFSGAFGRCLDPIFTIHTVDSIVYPAIDKIERINSSITDLGNWLDRCNGTIYPEECYGGMLTTLRDFANVAIFDILDAVVTANLGVKTILANNENTCYTCNMDLVRKCTEEVQSIKDCIEVALNGVKINKQNK